jgi:uncharacterized short protein YbdD (DUF466 family)
MITFSEIETTTKRASKAAGFSWGVAEEIGKSIRSLELFGLPGIINLNKYLKKIKKKHPKKIAKIEKKNKTKDKELCPIYSGIAFLDHSLELEKLKSLKFYNVSYPLLMLPFISRASEMMSKKILVQFDKSSFLLNFDKSIFSKDIEKQAQSIAKVVNIEFMENKNSFSKQNWKELYKLSEETFVDESDSLKKTGAGAGLTDND